MPFRALLAKLVAKLVPGDSGVDPGIVRGVWVKHFDAIEGSFGQS